MSKKVFFISFCSFRLIIFILFFLKKKKLKDERFLTEDEKQALEYYEAMKGRGGPEDTEEGMNL